MWRMCGWLLTEVTRWCGWGWCCVVDCWQKSRGDVDEDDAVLLIVDRSHAVMGMRMMLCCWLLTEVTRWCGWGWCCVVHCWQKSRGDVDEDDAVLLIVDRSHAVMWMRRLQAAGEWLNGWWRKLDEMLARFCCFLMLSNLLLSKSQLSCYLCNWHGSCSIQVQRCSTAASSHGTRLAVCVVQRFYCLNICQSLTQFSCASVH